MGVIILIHRVKTSSDTRYPEVDGERRRLCVDAEGQVRVGRREGDWTAADVLGRGRVDDVEVSSFGQVEQLVTVDRQLLHHTNEARRLRRLPPPSSTDPRRRPVAWPPPPALARLGRRPSPVVGRRRRIHFRFRFTQRRRLPDRQSVETCRAMRRGHFCCTAHDTAQYE